jgi:hypothetical protein
MKRTIHPVLYFVFILTITSLACASLAGGGNAPATEADAPAETEPLATNTVIAPAPTQKPTNTPRPTNTPIPPAPDFFKEEFEGTTDPDNWFHFTFGPGGDDDQDLQIFQEGDGLTLDLGALDLYLYYMYEPYEYDDVALTLVAENLGRNNNNVSIVCRLDYDNAEWYEFSFESGGVWFLYAYKEGYNVLDNGGSNALNQGKAINEYAMTCDGNKITMSINGKVLKTHTDNKYNLGEGLVGFNISSLNVLPIIVNVKSFEIAEP